MTTELRQQRVARIYKRLANVQRNERLADCTWSGRVERATSPYFRTVIPEILNDIGRLLQAWERAGTLNPFEKIYEVSRLLSSATPSTSVDGDCRKYMAIWGCCTTCQLL